MSPVFALTYRIDFQLNKSLKAFHKTVINFFLLFTIDTISKKFYFTLSTISPKILLTTLTVWLILSIVNG